MKQGASTVMAMAAMCLLAVVFGNVTGCTLRAQPKQDQFRNPTAKHRLPLSDPAVTPLIAAASASPRRTLGFPELPSAVAADIYTPSSVDTSYDAMLFLASSSTSWNIYYRLTPTGYAWSGETVLFTGPGRFTMAGDNRSEYLVMSTRDRPEEVPTPPGAPHFVYHGDRDIPGATANLLTAAQANSLLREWGLR